MEMEKKKKKKSSPNAYLIIFCVIVAVAVLSWFIPGGEYDVDEAGQAIAGTYHTVESRPQGIWEILMAPIIGMIGSDTTPGAISISFFIMMFGAFLEMTDQTNALKIAIKRITQKNQNNERKLIALLVLLMMLFGTIEGAYEEGFVYLLMFLPVILAMGFDSLTAVMIVILGCQGGCFASTINPFAVGIASEIAGISPGDGLGYRIIIFIIMYLIITTYIFKYAEKVKKNPELSPQYYRREEDLLLFQTKDEDLSLSSEQKKALRIFIALFVIMIVSLVPWDSLNENWVFFVNFTNWLTDIPILGTIIGKGLVPFGHWYFNELSMLLLLMTFIMGKVMGYSINKSIDIVIKGASGIVSTALIVAVARGIQVVMNNGLITPTILHFGEISLSSLPQMAFILISFLFYIVLAIFIPSSSGLAAATMSIMASLSAFAGVHESMMVNAYMFALGVAKMFTPTSVIVMTCLATAHIEYNTWMKHIWKFLLLMVALGSLFLAIGINF